MYPFISLASANPAAGNIETSTYILILVIAGILIIGTVVAGIFTRKKK